MLHSTIKYVPSTGTTTTGTYDTEFMNALSSVGKMISVRIYQGNSIIFNDSSINSTTISVDGSLLKSLMKTVEIELNGLYLLLDEEFTDVQIGVSKDRGQTYYYVSYGKFVGSQENEQIIETNATKITCYDEMIKSMKPYDLSFNYTESTTNRAYFNAVANAIGLSVGSSIPSNGVMAKIRNHETYVDSNTYRDVLDDFAEMLGGCIIVKNSTLELIKPTSINVTLDEDQLKSINYKPIFNQVSNITLSRMPQEDNVHYPEQVGSGESIKIENNLLVEGYQDTSGVIDRTPYLELIYNAISAWGSYYPIELESFGYCIYEPCDKLTIRVQKADGTYTNLSVIWMSNSIKVSQGIEESMISEAPESGETDYTKSSSTSLAERNTYLYVDKVEQTIEAKITGVEDDLGEVETSIRAELGSLSSRVSSTETKVDSSINHISYLYGYGDSATQQPGDGAFTYSSMPSLVSGKYIWRMSLAYTNENPTSDPTKTYEMIQGAQGEPGQGEPGTDGYNSATIYLYKRAASAPSKPAATNYTFSTHSLSSVPSGWSITVPSGTNPLYVSTVSVSSQSDTVSIASSAWSTPQIMASNGTNGTSYYTHIRYSANSDGSSMTSSPQANTKYIGVYTGTSSTAPTTASSYTWSKYVGDNITITSIQYTSSTSGVFPAPTSGWQSSPPIVAEGSYLWTKVNYSTGDPSYSVSYQGKNGTNGIDGDDGVSVTGIDNLYYLKNARLDIVPNGNTTQGANPTPDAPQEIHSVKGDNEVRVVGFNVWDEEWEVGYINPTTGEATSANNRIRTKNFNPCLPNTAYYVKDPSSDNNVRIFYYDADKNFVSETGWKGNQTVTTPSNAYFFKFIMGASYGTTYNHDICINISDPAKNGEYEPYKAQVYPITLPVENLLDINDYSFIYSDMSVANNSIIISSLGSGATSRIYFSQTFASGDYTISATCSEGITPRIWSDKEFSGGTFNSYYNGWFKDFTNYTSVTLAEGSKVGLVFNGTPSIQATITNIQLERGTHANTYNPYGANFIELNALGNYKDYFYKSDGKWYIHKETTLLLFNGTEDWRIWGASQTDVERFVITDNDSRFGNFTLCDKLYYTYGATNYEHFYYSSSSSGEANQFVVYINKSRLTTVDADGFKAWLAQNNLRVVTALRTPMPAEVTDETLIAQLDNLALAISYDGGTNLFQTNSDNPFILTYNADALTRPNKPVAEVTTSSNLPEVWSLQPATFINGYRYYNSLQVHYDNNTLTWTDVVEDSSMTYVSQQVTSMNTDIVQNAEAIALKADRSTVDTSISSLNNRVGKVESDSAELQVTASGISETVSSIQTNLSDNYLTTEETKAEIKKSADSISETFSQTVTDEINGVTNTVSTMIRRSGTGIDIGIEGTDNSFVSHFDNDSLDFNNTSTDTTVAWVDASDGLGGKELSVGDYKQQSNRWRIFTRQNGSHLTFTRHS